MIKKTAYDDKTGQVIEGPRYKVLFEALDIDDMPEDDEFVHNANACMLEFDMSKATADYLFCIIENYMHNRIEDMWKASEEFETICKSALENVPEAIEDIAEANEHQIQEPEEKLMK